MTVDRVMLLIDADNVSVDVMEQGLRLLMNQHGGVHVRRAYCTAESAVKHQAFFKRMGIKPMVNLAAGKNSTDIALAVDAIDLVMAERPDVVVIASSDSDFAPLVQRLREKGCVVRGIGQKGKTGDETREVYDDYTVFEHRKGAAAPRAAERQAPPPRKTAARGEGRGRARGDVRSEGRAALAVAAPAPEAAEVQLEPPAAARVQRPVVPPSVPAASVEPEAAVEDLAKEPAPKKTPVARKTAAAKTATGAKKSPAAKKAPAAKKEPAAKKAVAAKKAPAAKKASTARKTKMADAAADLPVAVAAVVQAPPPPPPEPPKPAFAPRSPAPSRLQDVMRCLPELGEGRSLALNVAVQRLREAQLLGKNSSSLKLFSQLSDRFELMPPGKPSQVSWRP